MTRPVVVLELSRVEAAHLRGLVAQFDELLDASSSGAATRRREAARADPAMRRLFPDAYADAAAAREFRDVTEGELLARRRADAALLLTSIADVADLPEDADDAAAMETAEVALDRPAVQAWLRTIAAIRLVLATRLGISEEDDHDSADPRFGIYDWLGYRLEGLVRAAERAD